MTPLATTRSITITCTLTVNLQHIATLSHPQKYEKDIVIRLR